MENKFGEEVEKHLAKIVIDNEYNVSESNQAYDFDDFEACVALFDADREEKDYDWMSDIFIPEFPSHMLQQSAEDVAQYFQTRDFVECYVMDDSMEALDAADAAKELVNRTLNRRDLYFYHKYVRAKLINHISGRVWLKAWWEQDVSDEVVGYENDEFGEPNEDAPVVNQRINKDCFNFEVLDPRNVFTDNRYVYSAQQKAWIIIRSEVTYQDLLDAKDRSGYFNLDIVKSIKISGDSETKTKVADRDDPQTDPQNTIGKYMDRLERYGKFWYKDGKPGVDKDGKIIDGATLEECVMTFVKVGATRVLIGFHKTPYIDTSGRPYKPIIRGICYIHPTRDNGVGDGKYSRELQVAINDTFNMTNDRTRLAMMPTMKGKKYLLEDTDSIYFEPNHIIDVEDPNDLQEFQISDNIQGGMTQFGVLTDKMRQITSTTPPDLGSVPALSSTTATATSFAQQGSGRRGDYKSMTFENTALHELFWMIQQMTFAFARPETGEKLMGDKVVNFDPTFDYFYKPVSANIETEQSKQIKIQRWLQNYQLVAQAPPNPKTFAALNYIQIKINELMGDEFAHFAHYLLDPNAPVIDGGQGGGLGGDQLGAPSNQYQLPQSTGEVAAREGAGGQYY